MMVTRDSEKTKPYSGTTELVSGEIGEDLAHYLATSEQIRSALGLGVLMGPEGQVRGAGGFLLQILGGLSDEELTQLELRIETLNELSRDLEEGMTSEEVLERLTDGDYRVIAESSVRYHCPNGRDYYRDRLLSLGKEDLTDIFKQDESISLTCEYTKKTYEFDRSEFADVLDDEAENAN
jgi:molecular chaperone Hsp33